MHTSYAHTLASLLSDLQDHDLEAPAEALAMQQIVTAIRSVQPAARIDVDTLAGKTPAQAARAYLAAVAERETAKAAQAGAREVVEPLARRAVELIRADDSILTALAPRFATAATNVLTAHAAGIRHGMPTEEALRVDGAAYVAYEAAVADLDSIRSLVYDLRPADLQHPYRVARWIDVDSIRRGRNVRGDFGQPGYVRTDLDIADEHDGWLQLVEAGYILLLNSDEQRDAVVAKHEQVEAATRRRDHADRTAMSPSELASARRELAQAGLD